MLIIISDWISAWCCLYKWCLLKKAIKSLAKSRVFRKNIKGDGHIGRCLWKVSLNLLHTMVLRDCEPWITGATWFERGDLRPLFISWIVLLFVILFVRFYIYCYTYIYIYYFTYIHYYLYLLFDHQFIYNGLVIRAVD